MWASKLEVSPSFAQDAKEAMVNWQGAPDFAVIRDQKALAKLPEAERQQWQKF
jgi:hypothetical protein